MDFGNGSSQIYYAAIITVWSHSGPGDYTTYHYDAAGLLTSSVFGPRNKATTTYTYENGDCVKQASSDGGLYNYTYYTDLATRGGDPQTFNDILNYGVPVRTNKHLVRSFQNGTFYGQYSYTFDKAGRIETVIYRSDELVDVTRYEYDCSQ